MRKYEGIKFFPDPLSNYNASSEHSQRCLKILFGDLLDNKIEMTPIYGHNHLFQVIACAFVILISVKNNWLWVLELEYSPAGEDL